jgi:ribosome biogenesis protein BMS1
MKRSKEMTEHADKNQGNKDVEDKNDEEFEEENEEEEEQQQGEGDNNDDDEEVDDVNNNNHDASIKNNNTTIINNNNNSNKKQKTSSDNPANPKWTRDEDLELMNIVHAHGPKNWKNIAKIMGGIRTGKLVN